MQHNNTYSILYFKDYFGIFSDALVDEIVDFPPDDCSPNEYHYTPLRNVLTVPDKFLYIINKKDIQETYKENLVSSIKDAPQISQTPAKNANKVNTVTPATNSKNQNNITPAVNNKNTVTPSLSSKKNTAPASIPAEKVKKSNENPPIPTVTPSAPKRSRTTIQPKDTVPAPAPTKTMNSSRRATIPTYYKEPMEDCIQLYCSSIQTYNYLKEINNFSSVYNYDEVRNNFIKKWMCIKGNPYNWQKKWFKDYTGCDMDYHITPDYYGQINNKSSKDEPLIHNLEKFHMEEAIVHSFYNPCILEVWKDYWPRFVSQGWKQIEKDKLSTYLPYIAFKNESEKQLLMKSDYFYCYFPLLENKKKVIPGIHLFTSKICLYYFMARFPYLLQSTERFVETLALHGWTLSSAQNSSKLLTPQSIKSGEIYCTSPSTFKTPIKLSQLYYHLWETPTLLFENYYGIIGKERLMKCLVLDSEMALLVDTEPSSPIIENMDLQNRNIIFNQINDLVKQLSSSHIKNKESLEKNLHDTLLLIGWTYETSSWSNSWWKHEKVYIPPYSKALTSKNSLFNPNKANNQGMETLSVGIDYFFSLNDVVTVLNQLPDASLQPQDYKDHRIKILNFNSSNFTLRKRIKQLALNNSDPFKEFNFKAMLEDDGWIILKKAKKNVFVKPGLKESINSVADISSLKENYDFFVGEVSLLDFLATANNNYEVEQISEEEDEKEDVKIEVKKEKVKQTKPMLSIQPPSIIFQSQEIAKSVKDKKSTFGSLYNCIKAWGWKTFFVFPSLTSKVFLSSISIKKCEQQGLIKNSTIKIDSLVNNVDYFYETPEGKEDLINYILNNGLPEEIDAYSPSPEVSTKTFNSSESSISTIDISPSNERLTQAANISTPFAEAAKLPQELDTHEIITSSINLTDSPTFSNICNQEHVYESPLPSKNFTNVIETQDIELYDLLQNEKIEEEKILSRMCKISKWTYDYCSSKQENIQVPNSNCIVYFRNGKNKRSTDIVKNVDYFVSGSSAISWLKVQFGLITEEQVPNSTEKPRVTRNGSILNPITDSPPATTKRSSSSNFQSTPKRSKIEIQDKEVNDQMDIPTDEYKDAISPTTTSEAATLISETSVSLFPEQPVEKPLPTLREVISQAKRNLESHAATHFPVPMREVESEDIYKKVSDCINSNISCCFYITGSAGTGKSYTINSIVDKIILNTQYSHIPLLGTSFNDLNDFTSDICLALGLKINSQEESLRVFTSFLLTLSESRKLILNISEIDMLHNSIILELFKWLNASKHLIVLSSGNSVYCFDKYDLFAYKFKNNITESCSTSSPFFYRIVFSPYTYPQLESLVAARVSTLFNESALTIFCKKVQQTLKGDVRKLYELAFKAIEHAEVLANESDLNSTTIKDFVKLKSVNALFPSPFTEMKNTLASLFNSDPFNFNILAAIFVYFNGKPTTFSLNEANNAYHMYASQKSIPSINIDVKATLEMFVNYKVLTKDSNSNYTIDFTLDLLVTVKNFPTSLAEDLMKLKNLI